MILALLSLFAVVDCYLGHTINDYYFPGQSHRKDFIPMVVFAALFVGFSLETVGLVFFKKFTRDKNEEEPNQAPEPTAPTGRGSS